MTELYDDQYGPPRPLEVIGEDMNWLVKEILAMLKEVV
jgi:hypothetical protein